MHRYISGYYIATWSIRSACSHESCTSASLTFFCHYLNRFCLQSFLDEIPCEFFVVFDISTHGQWLIHYRPQLRTQKSPECRNPSVHKNNATICIDSLSFHEPFHFLWGSFGTQQLLGSTKCGKGFVSQEADEATAGYIIQFVHSYHKHYCQLIHVLLKWKSLPISSLNMGSCKRFRQVRAHPCIYIYMYICI